MGRIQAFAVIGIVLIGGNSVPGRAQDNSALPSATSPSVSRPVLAPPAMNPPIVAPDSPLPVGIRPPGPLAPKPEPENPSIAWHTALEGDAVTVELTDATSHYRIESLELIGPGGARIPAQLTRTVEHSFGTTPVGPSGPFSLGVAGGSSSGVGVGIGYNTSRPTRNTEAPPKTVTRARIALPDPAAYRADPKAWKLAAGLVDSDGAASVFEIPAPTE